MPYVVFATRIAAHAFSDAVDADCGYPRNGVRCGGGTHASVAQGRTTTYAQVVRNISAGQWGYPDDGPVKEKRGRGVLTTGGTQTPAPPATWDDPLNTAID